MSSITKPMLGRRTTERGSAPSDLSHDIAYDYRRRVGAYVRDLRIKAGMTQEALARHLGMSNTGVSALELGRSTISPEKYSDLATILGVDKGELGMFLLRHTNPWLHEMIFGAGDKQLKRDLARLPTRLKSHVT